MSGYSKLLNCKLVEETEEAVKLLIETTDGEFQETWFPESQISFQGDGIWVSDWFLEKKESEIEFGIKIQ